MTEALHRVGHVALWSIVAIILVYLALPTFVVVPLSFSSQSYLSFPPEGWSTQWYARMAGNPAWLAATQNSLIIGIGSAAASMVLGTLAALAVVRGSLKAAGAISALVVAPIMLPHVILAIGLYPVMVEVGLLRTHLAAIVGHTVVGMPLVFITVMASLKSHGSGLELAAMTLGADPWHTFWRVTFPLIRPGVVAGGILAFASSFDELMLSLFLTGAGTRTLPRLIWEQLTDYLTPTIAAVATLIGAFTLVLLAALSLVQRRAGGVHG